MVNFVMLNQAAEGNMGFLLMMVLVFVVMYFFMIRPQQKRQKEMVKFRESLQKGSKIVTAGGIYGVVKSVSDATVVIEISSNVDITIDKAMVMQDPSTIEVKKK